jgi:hypothetical protein
MTTPAPSRLLSHGGAPFLRAAARCGGYETSRVFGMLWPLTPDSFTATSGEIESGYSDASPF